MSGGQPGSFGSTGGSSGGPPPGSYPPPAGSPPPPERSWFEQNRSWLLVVVGVLVIGALIGALVVALGDDEAAADEVFLQPVLTDGPDPFTDTVTTATTGALPAETTGSRTGSEPGLYGGSRDTGSCDREAMVDFLRANPDKAAAWARVQGITTERIEDFLADLTPILLRGDTRVTNHGFRDGRATPFQAVLQAGTAVMVDRAGVPRVRCSCGNPLLPPTEVQAPRFVGDEWPDWDADFVQVVFVDVEVDVFVLVDVVSGDRFERPVGTDGEADTDEGGEPEPEPTVPPTSAPGPDPVPEPAPAPVPEPVQTVECGGFEGITTIQATIVDCDTATTVAVNVVSGAGPAGWNCSEVGVGELGARAFECFRDDAVVYFEAFF